MSALFVPTSMNLPRPGLAQEPTPPHPAAPALRSSELLRGEREVVIRHGDQTYRLRHTRNDKLILTK